MELRIVNPKTLEFKDNKDPREIAAAKASDAGLKANVKAIGFIQPPLFAQEDDGSLTIIAGRRRLRAAIANKVKELAILVKPADPLDNMRAVAENAVREPMSPVDLWRSFESLASENWTEEAIAAAFATTVRQVKKLRLLGKVLPEILERIGQGDMPQEHYLRAIASAPIAEQAEAWEAHKPKKKDGVSWHAIANALSRRQMFARDASFGETEQQAFGITWIEDLFAPANEDSRFTTDAAAFLAAQRAWLESNLPENGAIIEMDQWGNAQLPKGAERIWSTPTPDDRIGHYIDPRSGAIKTVAYRIAKRAAAAKGMVEDGGEGGEPTQPKTRPDITGKGMEMIGEMRTEALHGALSRPDIADETLIALLILALAADNVTVRTGDTMPMRSLVAKMIEGGKISADAALIRATAIKALKATLSCQLKYNGSGLAARIAGDAIGADAELPTMATEEFLPSLSRAALERLGSGMGVLPRGKVKDTRAAVIEQARETRVVLPEAHFALSDEEAAKFARGYYQYAEGEEDADDEASETNALDDLDGGVDLGDAPSPDDQAEQPHAAAA
ncbi:ParB N-terminal domain-containing protein [Rhodoblastus acidophilus]|uniref:ParB N-terminal domain-containing protein n=1 Tax=Rhodoblastus acidophilus TaxID=1074 RepID=UPI0022249708|nr:ParB N-terminal domain-containing protein [Rhodoblastus acidophilus]